MNPLTGEKKSPATEPAEAFSPLRRPIELCFAHTVHFTENVFDLANPLLGQVLAPFSGGPAPKILVVVDEGLSSAQPDFSHRIEAYFAALWPRAKLAAAPIILEGGERLKNSYFHVSEIQSHIDRHDIDRHSYLLAVGGGALLDVAGFAATTAHRG